MINALIKEGFTEIVIEIKPTGILNTYSRNIAIVNSKNTSYDGNFLEYLLKEITSKMIEEGNSFRRIKLEELLHKY